MLPTHQPASSAAPPTAASKRTTSQPNMTHLSGYPHFAAMISSHPSFFVFRRFSALRARMILRKQDRISELEMQLEQVDRDEQIPIHRCSFRDDANPVRERLLEKLDLAMAEYDDINHRTRIVLGMRTSAPRDVQNLNQWVDGYGSISWSETEYLAHGPDLMSLGPQDIDGFLKSVASRIEDAIIWISSLLGWDFRVNYSSDPGVHIFSNRLITTLSRLVLAVLASSILLAPVLVLTLIDGLAARLAVALISNTIFVTIVSVVAEVRTGEVFVAGAAYAAVMIVYIAGTN